MLDVQGKAGPVRPAESLGHISLTDWAASGLEETEYVLSIAGVHQDAVTGEWALTVANHAIQLVGECSVRSRWWKIGELSNLRVFRDAVQTATTADIVIVSVRGIDQYPWISTIGSRRGSRFVFNWRVR